MFVDELHTVTVPPNLWRLTAVLPWRDHVFGAVDFPAGTVTDLGSTPQRLRRFESFDPTRTARRSSVGHDCLYQTARWPDGRPCTRAEADYFLYVAMLAEGHSKALAWAWWVGVRSGGWRAWSDYRKAEADAAGLISGSD